jgi:hypothetical protein
MNCLMSKLQTHVSDFCINDFCINIDPKPESVEDYFKFCNKTEFNIWIFGVIFSVWSSFSCRCCIVCIIILSLLLKK